VKINIGCGKQTWDDFYCVDAVRHQKASRPPDLIHAFEFDGAILQNPLPLPGSCADEVHNYHFIEHFYRWEAPALINEFCRLLKPGGSLVMELPDIALAARNLLKGHKDQLCMWPIYGDPSWVDPYMCHRWGYTQLSITALLEEAGLTKIKISAPQTHGRRINRDMRIEAVK